MDEKSFDKIMLELDQAPDNARIETNAITLKAMLASAFEAGRLATVSRMGLS